MNPPGHSNALALVVRSHPYAARSARENLDLALAAAALDRPLQLYFIGAALLQLVAQRDVSAALLPTGYRAWSSLPGLGEAQFYAEREWLKRCERNGLDLMVPVTALGAEEMRAAWRDCRQLLAL